MTSDPSGRRFRPADRHRDDAGGVWITTGIVLGIVLYAFIVLMLAAGFRAVLPLVILPPVVLGLIAANSLLGGGRSYGRSAGAPKAQGQAPLTSSRPGASSGNATSEEPRSPR